MKSYTAFVLFTAAIGVAAAPSPGCGQTPGVESGPHTVNVNGQDRQFIVRVPEGYDTNSLYRLIFGVHWWGGSMEDVAYGQTVAPGIWNYYGLESLADETAIFVAPQGIDGNWYNEGGSDFAFFDEINRLVEGSLCVDTDLRFSIGFSWGGSTTVGLGCRDSEFPLRAITAIGAAGPFECKPTHVSSLARSELISLTFTHPGNPGTAPIGYLGIHGIADNPDNGRGMRDRIMSNNGCTGQENPQPGAGSLSHVRSDYQCSGPPVTWITFVSLARSTMLVCLMCLQLWLTGWWTYPSSLGWWSRGQWFSKLCPRLCLGVVQLVLRSGTFHEFRIRVLGVLLRKCSSVYLL